MDVFVYSTPREAVDLQSVHSFFPVGKMREMRAYTARFQSDEIIRGILTGYTLQIVTS